MWWTILPSYLIVTTCFAAPPLIVYGSCLWYSGSVYGRCMATSWREYKAQRDVRIRGGDPMREHKYLGLPGIPDDD